MIKQDGTRVVGSVLEKQEARETYDTAVSQGQQASLMEQQTPDVFQVSVGNIPSNEQVQIELVYATELSEDEENDSIRFHLPVHIGLRYGEAPQATQSTSTSFKRNVFISSSSPTPFLTLAMSVEAIAPISKIGCPSHTVSTELGPDPKLPISRSSHFPITLGFLFPPTLRWIKILSWPLNLPARHPALRCRAAPHARHRRNGLTLVPRFKLPDLSRQEFVFMVDRSGSMGGSRIEAARKALVVMLRALPTRTHYSKSCPSAAGPPLSGRKGANPITSKRSRSDAPHRLDEADYGGTEIRGALQHCFKARKLDRPMSVLVLTDGDAWDLDGVLSEVKSAVANASKNAFLRVSVLGIGNSASTAMCEAWHASGTGLA
ncbi:hypothetical protein B0H13DRAFT_2356884 [Mycena leptocephala]|nr:hypothetical protein B0H13DRAFT_2356884 [Mycena leptocephala]